MPASGSTAALHAAGGGRRHRRLTWGPATAADIERFYGEASSSTLRAFVVKLDGEPVGVAGVARKPDANVLFTDHKAELEPYLSSVTVWRAVHAALRVAGRMRVEAEADHAEGERWLRKLGFEQRGDRWVK